MEQHTLRHILWPYKEETNQERCEGCGDYFPCWELEAGLCLKCREFLERKIPQNE